MPECVVTRLLLNCLLLFSSVVPTHVVIVTASFKWCYSMAYPFSRKPKQEVVCVCMHLLYICVYIYMYVRMYIYIYICVCMYAPTVRTYVYMYLLMDVRIFWHMYKPAYLTTVHTYIHASIHTYVLTYVCTYIRTCVLYIHVYVRTYVHTYVYIRTYCACVYTVSPLLKCTSETPPPPLTGHHCSAPSNIPHIDIWAPL